MRTFYQINTLSMGAVQVNTNQEEVFNRILLQLKGQGRAYRARKGNRTWNCGLNKMQKRITLQKGKG